MGFATAPTHLPGDTCPSADWNTLANDINSGLARALADSGTLGIATASIDFTSIPATFAQLMLVLYGRGDTAAGIANVQCRFNNDSAADYHQQAIDAVGTTVTAADAGAAAGTSAVIGHIPAATAPANAFGQLDMVIAHYTNAVNQKTFAARSYAKQAATGVGSGSIRTVGGIWMAAPAAISRFTIFPGAGNFAAGTRAVLYGLPQ